MSESQFPSVPRSSSLLRWFLPVATTLWFIACDAPTTGLPAARGGSSLDVSPSVLTLRDGDVGQFQATLSDAAGTRMTNRDLTWTSLQPGIASVYGDGRVEAKHPGEATIRVQSPAAEAESEVTVIVLPVADEVALVVRDELYLGTAGEPLPDSVEARVVDRGGLPVPGVAVSFSVDERSGIVSPVVVQTDENGYARVEWTLGTQLGSNAVEVSTPSPAATGPQGSPGNGTGPRKKLYAWGGAGEPKTLVVDPDTDVLVVEDAERLLATVSDRWGNIVEDVTIDWISSDESIVTVDQTGSVRARRVGQSMVTARVMVTADDSTTNGPPTPQEVSGTASIVVEPPGTGATLSRASGNAQTGTVGEVLPEPLAVRLRDGTVGIPGVAVNWSVSQGGGAVSAQTTLTDNDGVARVEWTLGPRPGGQEVTAWVQGTSAVTFSANALAGSAAQIDVTPSSLELGAAQSLELSATVADQYGNPIQDRPVSWSSSDGNVASVDVGGMVTGVSSGTATISASLDGATGSASVAVTGGSDSGTFDIRVGPPSDTIDAIGAHRDLTATVTDGQGAVVSGAEIAWVSLNPEVASVDPFGRITSRSVGVALITASLTSGPADTATIYSRQIVTSVSVAPSNIEVTPGESVVLTARAADAMDVPVEGATYDWSTTDSEVADLQPDGGSDRRQLVAGTPGTATVLVESAGVGGVASVTVTPTPVAAVTVDPTSMSLEVGESATATAVARDAGGNPLDGRAITWSSDDAAVASVQDGVVTGVGAGTTDVHAVVDGQSASLSVVVQATQPPPPPAVAVVEVTPASVTIDVGKAAQLSVETRGEDGAVLDRPVTWSSADPSIATVDQNGRVKGVSGGTATISAESEGVVGSATVTVRTAPGPSVDVMLQPGQDLQQIINNNPPGTVFGFEPGTYKRLQLTPKDGQVFIGGEGVVLDGENTAQFAFQGGSVGLHLKDLEITRYIGNQGAQAVILGWDGRDWVLENLYVHHNGAAGASPRHGARVIGGTYSYNESLGLTVNHANDVVIDGVELAYNNIGRTQDPLWEAGGIKITVSDAVTVKNSFVHHNNGPGIWYDISATNGVMEDNVVEDNNYAGIFYEVSLGCTITGNQIRRNGFDNDYWHGAGVLLSDGASCLVTGNTLEGNRQGVIILEEMRRDHGASNNTVRDNDIDMAVGVTGFATSVPQGSKFELNRYTLHDRARPFQRNGTISWSQWQAAGYDVGGSAR